MNVRKQITVAVRVFAIGLIGVMPSPFLLAATDTPASSAANTNSEGHKDVTLSGTVKEVDPGRDRVVVTVRNGHKYTLDTSRAQITLRNIKHPGETGDLIEGMRIRATGTLLAEDVLAADRISVLALYSAPVTAPAAPVKPRALPDPRKKVVDTAKKGDTISLRGTIESLNDLSGIIVVRINNHHRTIRADGDTEFRGVRLAENQRVPFLAGDRITVVGLVRPDQTVVADVITLLKRPVQRDIMPHELSGRVSHTSDRLGSRDIKVRVTPDKEVTVHVPTGIAIVRADEHISVHELTESDTVRVSGKWDGEDFQASRIEVIDTDVF